MTDFSPPGSLVAFSVPLGRLLADASLRLGAPPTSFVGVVTDGVPQRCRAALALVARYEHRLEALPPPLRAFALGFTLPPAVPVLLVHKSEFRAVYWDFRWAYTVRLESSANDVFIDAWNVVGPRFLGDAALSVVDASDRCVRSPSQLRELADAVFASSSAA